MITIRGMNLVWATSIEFLTTRETRCSSLTVVKAKPTPWHEQWVDHKEASLSDTATVNTATCDIKCDQHMLCCVCGWQCTACEWVSQTTVDKTESQNIHPKHKIVPWNEVERWRFTSKAKGISVIRRMIWLRFFHIKLQMNDLIVQLINRKRLFSQFECCRCISFRIKSIQCHLLMCAVKNGQSFWVHTYEHMRHLQRRAPAYEHSDKTELNAHRKRWHRGSAIH